MDKSYRDQLIALIRAAKLEDRTREIDLAYISGLQDALNLLDSQR
jgi:hypothetical protein